MRDRPEDDHAAAQRIKERGHPRRPRIGVLKPQLNQGLNEDEHRIDDHDPEERLQHKVGRLCAFDANDKLHQDQND